MSGHALPSGDELQLLKRMLRVYVERCAREKFAAAYCGPDGRRCGSRAFIEFHHLKPWMAGGKATVDNLSLRCALHNRYEAQLFYSRPNVTRGAAVRLGPDRAGSRPTATT
jgi:hypothetical protein